MLIILSGNIVVRRDRADVRMPRVSVCGGTRSVREACATPGMCLLSLVHLPADALARRIGLRVRQFERRFLETYGQSLRSYRRQIRCSQMLPA